MSNTNIQFGTNKINTIKNDISKPIFNNQNQNDASVIKTKKSAQNIPNQQVNHGNLNSSANSKNKINQHYHSNSDLSPKTKESTNSMTLLSQLAQSMLAETKCFIFFIILAFKEKMEETNQKISEGFLEKIKFFLKFASKINFVYF